ncbi:MAG: hypothetical protein ABL898_18935, partial [Hyphomicrobiaceae bacterium]
LALAISGSSGVRAADSATQWRDGCANCHGVDATAYAKKEMKLADGKLVMHDTGLSLVTVLSGGHGRLDADAVKAMDAYLLSLVSAK